MKKLLPILFSQLGIKEIPGRKDNPEVLKYFFELGYDGHKLKDETAWCSAFANWVCKTACLDYSKLLNARSWLRIGTPVTIPQLGDVVILWREKRNSWKGHVGFYMNHDEKYIYILGGNQSNKVCIRRYPKGKLLGYRRLV
ncbi:MAG: TIGR02594 family protein [Flavobacteriaceae bacterium]|nr:TIGR02594 family protein [Flavobacteriaceae bacterium]